MGKFGEFQFGEAIPIFFPASRTNGFHIFGTKQAEYTSLYTYSQSGETGCNCEQILFTPHTNCTHLETERHVSPDGQTPMEVQMKLANNPLLTCLLVNAVILDNRICSYESVIHVNSRVDSILIRTGWLAEKMKIGQFDLNGSNPPSITVELIFNILQNNGRLAHQEVEHVHFHMIPKPNASLGLGIKWSSQATDHAFLGKLAETIRGQLEWCSTYAYNVFIYIKLQVIPIISRSKLFLYPRHLRPMVNIQKGVLRTPIFHRLFEWPRRFLKGNQRFKDCLFKDGIYRNFFTNFGLFGNWLHLGGL